MYHKFPFFQTPSNASCISATRKSLDYQYMSVSAFVYLQGRIFLNFESHGQLRWCLLHRHLGFVVFLWLFVLYIFFFLSTHYGLSAHYRHLVGWCLRRMLYLRSITCFLMSQVNLKLKKYSLIQSLLFTSSQCNTASLPIIISSSLVNGVCPCDMKLYMFLFPSSQKYAFLITFIL